MLNITSYEKKYPPGIYQQRIFYDSVPIYGEDNPDEIIKQNAQRMQLNEHKIIRAQKGVYIIKFEKALQFSYYPLEEVKEQVKYYYETENYNNLIEKERNTAVITINEEAYQAISAKMFN